MCGRKVWMRGKKEECEGTVWNGQGRKDDKERGKEEKCEGKV